MRRIKKHRTFLLCLLCLGTVCCGEAFGQVQLGNVPEREVEINLAEKSNLDLAALVRFLADQRGMKIVANSDNFPGKQNNRVLFFGDLKVTSESLEEVVQSVLRSNGFALVRSDVPEIFQIVELANVRPFTQLAPEGNVQGLPPSDYVTGVFLLKHLDPLQAKEFIEQLLYSADSNKSTNYISTIPDRNILVVTETTKRLVAVKELLGRFDVPKQKVLREFYSAQHVPAEELLEQLSGILDLSNDGSSRPVVGQTQSRSQLKIYAISRANQLILSGSREQINEALSLLERLDVTDQLEVKNYQFENVSAKRIDELIRQGLQAVDEKQAARIYQSDVNEQANQLIATTRPEIHLRIESLQQQLDREEAAEAKDNSPIKFYTLKNVKAVDMLETLLSVNQPGSGLSGRRSQQNNRNNGINPVGGFGSSASAFGAGIGNALGGNGFGAGNGFNLGGQGLGLGNQGGPGSGSRAAGRLQTADGQLGSGGAGDNEATDGSVSAIGSSPLIPGEANITVDENTNTLIVVAEPAIQQLYAKLIEKLDVRRPQVLIEVKLVTITGTDDLQIGIEASGGDRTETNLAFAFTNFGLNEFSSTGAITLSPGLGFNGALIDTLAADLILQALATHSRARVVTAPRILVNDNATGFLSSVAEVPFQSNSIGNTVALSSFGGFAQAGTIISVTPQISDDDYLNLEFDVQVNAFTGEAIAGSPPPRNTDQVTSQVSIPDGSTIIVGGMNRNSLTGEQAGLPFIENIPLLRNLARNISETDMRTRLYVFIKPTILRDDKFRDLQFLSETERKNACIPDDFPTSGPILIR